jgi:UDP-N-acetylmuramyl pentapeptide synthase
VSDEGDVDSHALLGRPNVENMLAAAAVGHALGVVRQRCKSKRS